jgi:hypothetical protein
MKDNYTFRVEGVDKPFLSIVTRCMEGKRPKGITLNQESVNAQLEKNYEQIFINDPKGYGMLEANKSFAYVSDMIKGQYIHLLDDDDIYIKESFTLRMKEIADRENPDIILFKMYIHTGDGDNIYPKSDCWGDIPKIARIGGSCFIVKKELYQRYIHEFGVRRCGDFQFLRALWTEPNLKAYWHDEIMCESKPSHGKPESK